MTSPSSLPATYKQGDTGYATGGTAANDPNAFVTNGAVDAKVAAAVSAAGGGTAIDDSAASSTKTFSSANIDATYLKPLPLLATVTAATALTKGSTQPVNVTAGAVTMTALPALSGLTVGDRYGVEKVDSGPNTLAVPFASGDATLSGATQVLLSLPGTVELRVTANPAGGKIWKALNHVRSDAAVLTAVDTGGNLRKTGTLVPSDWTTTWAAKLATASTTLVRVGCTGDSVSEGYYTSSLLTKSWFALLIAALQTKYGDGGSGFIGATRSEAFGTGVSIPTAAINAYKANGSYSSSTGTWTLGSGTSFNGPGGTYITTGTAGNTQTITGRGTKLRIFTLSNSGGNSAYTYSIDNAAPVPVADGTGFTVQATTVTGLSAGSHTVTITTTEAKAFNFVGVEFTNATGVVGHNFSRYGAATQNYDNYIGGRGSGAWSGGSENPVDLAIYALGLNDANQGAIPTGVNLGAAAAINASSLTLSAALPPGQYRIDNERVEIIATLVSSLTVTLTGATGGTYTLSGGSGGTGTTSNIAFDATASTVQTAVRTLPGFSAATVSGSAGGPYTVTFPGSLSNPQLTANGANLTGTSPTVSVALLTGATLSEPTATAHSAGAAVSAIATRAEDWEVRSRRFFESVKSGNRNAQCAVFLPHKGNYDDLKLNAAYGVRARSVASVFGAVLVDANPIGRNNWNWMFDAGYWGTAANVGAAGSDTVHVSDAGAAFYATAVQPVFNP